MDCTATKWPIDHDHFILEYYKLTCLIALKFFVPSFSCNSSIDMNKIDPHSFTNKWMID